MVVSLSFVFCFLSHTIRAGQASGSAVVFSQTSKDILQTEPRDQI